MLVFCRGYQCYSSRLQDLGKQVATSFHKHGPQVWAHISGLENAGCLKALKEWGGCVVWKKKEKAKI